jgi:hypothetical protein
MNTSVTSDAPRVLPVWTTQDDAEYNRLSAEMNEDAKLQFTFFTFGITASTAVLGFLTSSAVNANAMPIPGLPTGVFFLVPLLVLYPTSLLIMNRARTRNRKAAYIITHLDYKRLMADGINDQTQLKAVREHPYLPWETALHILERTNKRVHKNAHFPPALRYMYACYSAIEFLCILLAIITSIQAPLISILAMLAVVIFFTIPVYVVRFQRAKLLRKELSIQGCVHRLLQYKFELYTDAPLYIRQWIDEFNDVEKPIPPI